VAVVADAADEDVGHLDGQKGRQHDVVGPPEGLPHQLAATQRHHLEHPRGHAARHLYRRPPKRGDRVQGPTPGYRNFPYLPLLMEHEDAQGGADCPLPQGARHEVAAVPLPHLGESARVIIPREVGLVTHLRGEVPLRQVAEHSTHPPVLLAAEKGNVR